MSLPSIQSLVKQAFQIEVNRPASDVRRLFFKETCEWTEDRKRIKELDVDMLAEQKVEAQPSAQRGMSEGYVKEIVRKTISVERVISGEAYMALTAHSLVNKATNVGKDIVDKIELDMRNFIGLGTGTSYTDNAGFPIDTTTADGLPLFSAAHTLKNVAGTYSNILTGAPSLTEDALESGEDYFSYNVRNNNGYPITMNPNTLITSNKAQVKNRAKRILGSMSSATIDGTTNSNSNIKNTYKDKYTHLVVDFDQTALGIPDTSLSFNWFLACIGGTPENSFQAYYVSWMSPYSAPVEIKQSPWTLSWVARACYGIGAVSPKGILRSLATL